VNRSKYSVTSFAVRAEKAGHTFSSMSHPDRHAARG
jgi:hypothetical protein